MDAQLPTITQVIANAVLVCCCSARVVMVVNTIGGEVSCPACKQPWRVKFMHYDTDPSGNGQAKLEITMEKGSAIILPDAAFAMPKRGH